VRRRAARAKSPTPELLMLRKTAEHYVDLAQRYRRELQLDSR
jgi:hypothetical protein